jgi:hypothetical protein
MLRQELAERQNQKDSKGKCRIYQLVHGVRGASMSMQERQNLCGTDQLVEVSAWKRPGTAVCLPQLTQRTRSLCHGESRRR